MATTATAHKRSFTARAADRPQSAVVFLVSVYRYIWADTTRHTATQASPDPVAVIQKLDAIIR